MKITRRQFLKGAAATGIGLALPLKFGVRSAHAYAVSPGLTKFITALPLFGGGGFNDPTVASVDPLSPYTSVDYYRITMGAFRHDMHPDLTTYFAGLGLTYSGTNLYGYADAAAATLVHKPLGAAILATKGRPVRLKFTNNLPLTHIIPFDSTIPMPNTGLRQDRAAVHLHGGLVPWASDGGPFHWFTPPDPVTGVVLKGASVVSWLPNNTGALTDDYYYPNNQSARFMWYHDHAIGITRTSAYAGLATGYLVTDSDETTLVAGGLPSIFHGATNDIPIVFQDKVFWDPTNDPNYSLYVTGAKPGDLWYPYLYEKAIWRLQGNAKNVLIPSAIPEMFGDTMLVNGGVYPNYTVNYGVYRLRLLNACNARFLNLKFVYEDTVTAGEPMGGYLLPTPAPVKVTQIGTEGGFLPTPVLLFDANGVAQFLNPLLLGPAERADIIVDFTGVPTGKKVILYNDAPAPYPIGAPIFDFYPGAPKNPVVTQLGKSPNTRTIMRFDFSGTGTQYTPPASIPVDVLPTTAAAGTGVLTLNTAAIGTHPYYKYFTIMTGTRDLTLNETFDIYGRLMQLVGTTVPLVKGTFGRAYLDPPTEQVQYGTIEIWRIFNLTADAHPMHVHLFNAMILSRQLFRVQSFNGIPVFTGPARGPDPNEKGWKETLKMYPGECITLAVLVEGPLATTLAGGVINHKNRDVVVDGGFIVSLPDSPRLATLATPVVGDEYVWHCHILEHEEHDMMRPLVAK